MEGKHRHLHERSKDMKRCEPRAPSKRIRTNKKRKTERISEHKSGDHVFNKGVKTIFFDIIKKYMEDKGITRFHDGMTQTDTPMLHKIVHEDKNWPLDEAVVSLIDEMAVPSGKKDKPDDNSILFGEGKRCLLEGVVSVLNRVINKIKNGDEKEQFNELRENLRDYIRNNFTHEGGDSRGEDGIYVHPEVKNRWMKQQGDSEEKFTECIDAIRQIFHNLVDAKDNDPEQWLIYNLAKEILRLKMENV